MWIMASSITVFAQKYEEKKADREGLRKIDRAHRRFTIDHSNFCPYARVCLINCLFGAATTTTNKKEKDSLWWSTLLEAKRTLESTATSALNLLKVSRDDHQRLLDLGAEGKFIFWPAVSSASKGSVFLRMHHHPTYMIRSCCESSPIGR